MKKRAVCGLILAAGYSSRMGNIKPLLPLGQSTVLDRVTESFIRAGIEDVYVVLGCHRKEILKKYFFKRDVHIVHNPNYPKGMFSSVQAGVNAIDSKFSAFLMTPADCPLIKFETIKAVSDEYYKSNAPIIYPKYNGKRGHPTLVSMEFKNEIINGDFPQGLRTLLSENEDRARDVSVDDEGVLLDMDTREDYNTILSRVSPQNELSFKAANEILEKYAPSYKVIRHCRKVSDVTAIIGKALNASGLELNLNIAITAALIHDIKRAEHNHALYGKKFLISLGYPRVGSVVGVHMGDGLSFDGVIGEHEIVYLADKLVREDFLVSVKERFALAFKKYAGNPEILASVENKKRVAEDIQAAIENIIGVPVNILLAEKG